MNKRGLLIGTYDTAAEGWTLASLLLGEATPKENLVEIPGRDGPGLDLATGLTEGERRFGGRTLEATLVCSNGTREERTAMVQGIINRLHGLSAEVVLPDFPEHYVTTSCLNVREEYNTLSQCAVYISATCDTWKYKREETVVEVTASGSYQNVRLENNGRRTVVPELVVAGGSIDVFFDGSSQVMADGTYRLVTLTVPTGGKTIRVKGTGTLTATYREAVV